MSLAIKTGLPGDHTLHSKYIVRFSATDPTTGADVAGVVVSKIAIFGEVVETGTPGDIPPVVLLPWT